MAVPPPGLPGKPQARRVKLDAASPAVTVVAYPNAQLFLQTLHVTGDRVHLVTRWGVEYAQAIVTAFEWTSYIADVRELHAVPGRRLLGLASVHCEATWNANSVLVVPKGALWHPLLAAQLVEVRHGVETRSKQLDDDSIEGASAMWSSMELLHALCRCVTLAEWRVRYPGTPIACCSALSECHLFAFCRFYAPPALLDEETMLLLSAHGGGTSATEMEATHVLYPTPDDEDKSLTLSSDASSASSETSATSGDDSASENEGGDSSNSSTSSVTQSSSDSAASQSLSGGDAEPDRHRAAPPPSRSDSSQKATTAQSRRLLRLRRGDESVARVESPLRASELASVSLSTTAANGAAATPAAVQLSNSGISSSSNPQAALVTRDWLRCCCRALRLLPLVPVSADAALRESLRTTGALLCTMLPPEDAKPLPFTHFLHIARVYHFAVDFLDGGSLTLTLARLQNLFGDLIKVRQAVEPVSGASRVDRGQGETRLFLYRNERKRDRNAVASHLRLLASQFDYAMDHVRQERRLLRCVTTGTQTSGPRYASIGVNTSEPAATTVTVMTTKMDAKEDTASVALKEDILDTSGAAEAAEWLQHLKNAEGKLLKSHHPRAASSPVSLKRARDAVMNEAEASEEKAPHDMPTRDESKVISTTSSASAAPASILPPPATGSTSDNRSTAMATSTGAGRTGGDDDDSSDRPASTQLRGAHDPSEATGATATPAAAAAAGTTALPVSIFPLPVTTPATEAEWRRAMVTSPETDQERPGSTAATVCYIPTYQLPPAEQPDLVQFLSSLPIFIESGARVEMEAMGVSCIFPSARDAADFLRVRYVEFGGVALHIYPLPDNHMPLAGSVITSDTNIIASEEASQSQLRLPGDVHVYPGSSSDAHTEPPLGLRWSGEAAVQRQQSLASIQDELCRALAGVSRQDVTTSSPIDAATTVTAGQTAGQRTDTSLQRGTPRARRSARKERSERRELEARRHRSERRYHHRHGSRTRSGSRSKRKGQ